MKDTLKAIVFGGIFLLPLLPLYVENDYFFPFITGKNFGFRIIVEIIFAAWVLLALAEPKYRPKFSWILATFAGLLVSMGISTALAEDPHTSFWSNYERMDGMISLIHVFLAAVVMGSVMLTEKVWNRFLMTSVGVSLFVAVYGLGQMWGVFSGGNGVRVDSLLGNAAYMAIYMLFNIFFAYLLILRTEKVEYKAAYAAAILVLAYTLLLTGTRGTFLGLVGGSVVTIGYIALFARRAAPELRRYAVGSMAVFAILVLGYFGWRNSDFVPETGALNRILTINVVDDLQVRMKIWSMAVEGIEERPVFGWGHGNFNFVFNTYYRPDIWNQEQWFDRVHNIFLDWMIAGGVVGFVAYFSIFGALIFYLFVRPVVQKREHLFPVPEQAVLLGLLAAYLIHNIVVFDNIISYIFFAALLALVHSRIATPIPAVERFPVSPEMVGQFAAPIVIIVAGFTIYFLNVPSMLAAGDIIDAMQAPTARERLALFHTALERGSFADQEIVEQLAQTALTVARTAQVPEDERNLVIQRAELELLRMAEEKPGDARIHNFLVSFYRTIGAIPQARAQAALAVSLSPEKPALRLEQAIVEIQAEELETAREMLKAAFELEQRNLQARIFYAAVLFRTGAGAEAKALIGEEFKAQFAGNEYALGSVEVSGDLAYLAELYELRVAANPTDAQNRASLAFLYFETKRTDEAVATLRQAALDIPSFATAATCYADNIETGKDPSTPCAPVATTTNAN